MVRIERRKQQTKKRGNADASRAVQEWFFGFLASAVVDLGSIDSRLAGIFSPECEVNAERVGITDQFLANAETYNAAYSNTAHFTRLFERAFKEAGYTPSPNLTILDIGAGSGANSVIPCLQLFPNCRVVATDISPDLLVMLRSFVKRKSLENRVSCLCVDAMNDRFKAGTFDVVVGAAILHHIIDPIQSLSAASNALHDGGIAFFFEPFEGMALIRIAFTLILERAEREGAPLDARVSKFLRAVIVDIQARTGTDKSDTKFRYMDDKWLFTRQYVEDACRTARFSSLTIVPHTSGEAFISEGIVSLLKLGLSAEPEILPPWAWETIRLFDEVWSPEMKRDLLLEGTMVFRKARPPVS